MGRRHVRRSMVFVSLAVALGTAVVVTVLAIPRGEDFKRRYHFAKWKAIILKGIVEADAPEPRLSLSREEDSAAWHHLMILRNDAGYGFLMQRVLEGGESDAAGAAIGLASIYDNIWDTRAPIAALILANEPALRMRAERAGSPLLQRVVRDLYTDCRDEVRNVKRSIPEPMAPAPGS